MKEVKRDSLLLTIKKNLILISDSYKIKHNIPYPKEVIKNLNKK